MTDPLLLNVLSTSHEYQTRLNWSQEKIYIYGSGSFAKDVGKMLQQNGINILGFIDHRNSETRAINHLQVYLPDDQRIDLERRRNSVVILGIHNREVNVITIIDRLKQLGYGRVLSPIDLYDDFSEFLGNRYWLTDRTYYSSHASKIEAAYGMLLDRTSQETLLSLLRFRITGDYSLLPVPDMKHQYFSPNLSPWTQPIRLVDCGAYDGDTLRSFVDAGYEFESIAAFEPDQDNFRKLSLFVSNNSTKIHNATLFPCGVYSSTRQLTFETGKGEASALSRTSSSVIQCVSLDECIPTFQATLIKMDIEGAEMEALQGAQKMIIGCKPALAISVYHTPAHLWEIPLLVYRIARENRLEYTYHLRAHAHNCFDTIFYAIPVR